jgi:hypothetical protein
MNNHHFSYPHVVPLLGATISGHATEPLAPVVPLSPQPPVPHAVPAAPAPMVASLAA